MLYLLKKNLPTYLGNNSFLMCHKSAHLWTFKKLMIVMPPTFKLVLQFQGKYDGNDTQALSVEKASCLGLLYALMTHS